MFSSGKKELRQMRPVGGLSAEVVGPKLAPLVVLFVLLCVIMSTFWTARRKEPTKESYKIAAGDADVVDYVVVLVPPLEGKLEKADGGMSDVGIYNKDNNVTRKERPAKSAGPCSSSNSSRVSIGETLVDRQKRMTEDDTLTLKYSNCAAGDMEAKFNNCLTVVENISICGTADLSFCLNQVLVNESFVKCIGPKNEKTLRINVEVTSSQYLFHCKSGQGIMDEIESCIVTESSAAFNSCLTHGSFTIPLFVRLRHLTNYSGYVYDEKHCNEVMIPQFNCTVKSIASCARPVRSYMIGVFDDIWKVAPCKGRWDQINESKRSGAASALFNDKVVLVTLGLAVALFPSAFE